MIDTNKKYRTLGGLSVRVLCTNVKSEYSVVAAILEIDGAEVIYTYTKEGLIYAGETNTHDLVEVSPYENFKVDDLCVVQNEYCDPIFRYFGMEVSGMAYCFEDGKTSFTATKDALMSWINCRKATPEEIQTKTIKG